MMSDFEKWKILISKSIFATLERLKSVDVAQRLHENKLSYEREENKECA